MLEDNPARKRKPRPCDSFSGGVALLKVGGGLDAKRAVAALVPLERLGYDSVDFRTARDAFLGADRLSLALG